MAGLIPPLRPRGVSTGPAGGTPSIAQPSPTTDCVAPSAAADQASPPSIRNRLQTLFGWRASSTKEVPSAAQFSQADSRVTKVLVDHTATSVPHRANPDQLPNQPKRRQLASPAGSPHGQLGILKMLEKNNNGANSLQGTDSLGARSWRSLAQTSFGLEFDRNVTELAEQKSQQLAALQEGIAQLPPAISLQYQALLHDIVAFRNPTERNTMLADLARNVAARLHPPK